MTWPSALSIAMEWPEEELTDEEVEEMIDQIYQYQQDKYYFEKEEE